VLQKDAEDLGATYLTSVLRRSQVLELVSERIGPTADVAGVPIVSDLLMQLEQESNALNTGSSRRVLH